MGDDPGTTTIRDPVAFELSRWRGGRYTCDTSDIVVCLVSGIASRLFLLSLYYSIRCGQEMIQFP